MKLIGAVDIGGTKIAVGAVREDGTIAHRRQYSTACERGFADAMQRIQRSLREIIELCGPLDGIGIGTPGPMDPLTGILGDIGTLPGWQGGNLIEPLQAAFDLPVAVENDADAAALAEFSWGTHRKARNFIYVTVSTGIGGGIILDGKLYRGVDGSHPELGHQVLDHAGPLCYCNQRGCWEVLASGTAMSAWMNQNMPGAPPLTAAQICERATHGDERALQAVKREAHYLGLGLVNLVTLFAPDVIVLGGGVMKSGSLFLDDVTNMVRELCTQVPAEKTGIELSSLGSDTGLLGAAQAWLSRYQSPHRGNPADLAAFLHRDFAPEAG